MGSKNVLILGALVAAAGAALLYKSSRDQSIVAGIVGATTRRTAGEDLIDATHKKALEIFSMIHAYDHKMRGEIVGAHMGVAASFHDLQLPGFPSYFTHGIEDKEVNQIPSNYYVVPQSKMDRIYLDGQHYVEGKRVVANRQS